MAATKFDRPPIDKNGVYDITLEEYHNNPKVCAGPSISAGGLATIESRSLKHFYYGWSGNPNAEKKDTQSMLLGRAAHAHMLGDEIFYDRFAILPFPDLRTNAAKDWKAKMEAAGKGVIKESDLEKIAGMAAELKKHPVVKMGLLDGWQEISLIWKDEETGVWLRNRPDVVAKDLVGGDYKATNDASFFSISRGIVDRGTHQQAALVHEAYEKVLGIKLENYVLLYQETSPPFVVNPILLSQDAIARGRVLNRRAIRLFAEALEKNEWPGYPERTTPLDTPEWYNTQFDKRQENDQLPTYFDAGITVDRRNESRQSSPVSDPLA